MTSLIKRQGYSDASTAARGALRCKVTSGDPVIAAIAGDDIYVDVRLPRASISIAGLVHDVAEARFALPRDGDVDLGACVTETLQDSVSDIGLRGRLPGAEAFMEPGAARIRLDVAWGHSADGIAAPPLIPVYTMRNGAILTNQTNIDFSEIYNAISNYSRESNGSFVNTCCDVTALGLNATGE